MKEFGESRHDSDKFRKVKFKGFKIGEFMKDRTLAFFLLLIMGLLIGFPSTFMLILKINPRIKAAVMIGAILNFTINFSLKILFNMTIYSYILTVIK